jgi:DNA-binding beta-propeller fold protein YncE
VAAIPTHGAGKVVRITRAGKVETLLEDQKALPAPIAVAADPATGDLLVADNVTDVLLLLPAGKAKEARPLVTIDGHKGHCQDMSVAFTKDGHVLFGGTGPVGVYRFPNEKGAAFGAPVLKERGDVAADPASKRWAAAQADRLHVYDADREVAELKYPDGRRMWMGGLAFTPGGTPVLALHLGGNRFEVMTADVEAKEFKPLFAWGQSRVTSLAVGRRAAWKD